MNSRVSDSINNKYSNYIFPFLWLHGEPQERIKEEIIAIKNSGCNEFCAESRPYENFCHEQWWSDFEFILKTAKALDMRVWLLDDKHYPTGYANGYLQADEYAHLRKILIRERQTDVLGPCKMAKIMVGQQINEELGEEIINVIAYKHTGTDELLNPNTAINLTDRISDGIVYWHIPEGVWRVCTTIKTTAKCEFDDRFVYYIDMLNKESCMAMINAVYQPHFEKFGSYFGNTFAGFFSDEPGFLNTIGTYTSKLGIMHIPYPWRDDLPQLIAESAGVSLDTVINTLPALWQNLGEANSLIRTHYMDVITKLYSENFTYLLGNWCREHGVMYIGHVIEDSNCHMRTGYGSGHFFRALDGQDMSGIDIVLLQEVPGIVEGIHKAAIADEEKADPDFFHYTLPKLAASHSHLQPEKKGRAMCEIFGAFGWAEGLPYMKQLADIMLVNGINHFVPHAFSPKEDDPDCPPHFYNGGKNIQYPLFKNLMEYIGRTSHIFCGARHKASVAVFYNAEGEWTGGKNELFQHICKNLAQNLIDFDIIPIDMLENAVVSNSKLIINNEEFGALVISESEIMPYNRLLCFKRLADEGLPVIFTNTLPEKSAEKQDISDILHSFTAVNTNKLSEYLRSKGIYEISSEKGDTKYLKFYHVTRDNDSIYMFSNDSIHSTIDTWLTLPDKGEFLVYDAWGNKCYKGNTIDNKLHLILEKGNAVIIVFGNTIQENVPDFKYESKRKSLNLKFDISLKSFDENNFTDYAENSPCIDITAPDRLPHFCGEIMYKTLFTPTKGYSVIDLGGVGETAEVWLNGKHIGTRVNTPYKFDISSADYEKENILEIKVRSNLAHKNRDWFSGFIWIPPTGVLGEISECKYI